MRDDETADQKRLRSVTDEIDSVMKKHDVGGIVLIASNRSAAWAHNLPTWADVNDSPQGMHVNFRRSLDSDRAEHTMHLLGCLRDMSNDCANIYGRIYRLGRDRLKEIGGLKFERKISGGSDRILDTIIKSN